MDFHLSAFGLLRSGSSGPAVVELQTALERLGYSVGAYGVDGQFGPATRAAVERFQRDAGIGVDGVVGPETEGALARYGAPISGSGSSTVPSSGTGAAPGGVPTGSTSSSVLSKIPTPVLIGGGVVLVWYLFRAASGASARKSDSGAA